jgi:uncharacterized protein (DUF1499 family)
MRPETSIMGRASKSPVRRRDRLSTNPLNLVLLIVVAMPFFSCAGPVPSNLGVTDGRLAPCPSKPNCVSSDAGDEDHAIAPLEIATDPGEAWRTTVAAVKALPRTAIVSQSDDYLHAECASTVFGFVDDLELHLRAAQGIIAVRSASRLGHSDLGVNRSRVEGLRTTLAEQGVVRPGD